MKCRRTFKLQVDEQKSTGDLHGRVIYIISLLMFANQCLERSPGEGKGYPLQYLGLENSMDCVVHRLQSQTPLSYFHFVSVYQNEAPTLPQGMGNGEWDPYLPDYCISKGGPQILQKDILALQNIYVYLKKVREITYN